MRQRPIGIPGKQRVENIVDDYVYNSCRLNSGELAEASLFLEKMLLKALHNLPSRGARDEIIKLFEEEIEELKSQEAQETGALDESDLFYAQIEGASKKQLMKMVNYLENTKNGMIMEKNG